MRFSYHFSIKSFVLLIFLLVNTSIYAHGDLSIRIKNKTEEISKDPNNAELYYLRGVLYLQHLDFEKAITDYEKAEALGFNDKLLYYKKAETFYQNNEFDKALQATDKYFALDDIDIKIHKLKAQILFKLNRFHEAISLYDYVLKKTIDLRPHNIIEYCNILLSIDNSNYKKAIIIIDFGLKKLGEHTFSLQLKKLEYQKASKQTEETIKQYNYFILNTNRKEFWYYKKAKYLLDVNEFEAAKIALQQSKITTEMLDQKFKSTSAIKNLQKKIQLLEIKLNQK